MNKFLKYNYHILTYILLYSSLIIAFFLGENVSSGPKNDLQYALKQVEIFNKDFLYAFFNYDTIEYPNRLSPIYITILLIFKKLFFSFDIARLVLLHIIILSQIYFYKCLKIIFLKKFSLNKRVLFFISCVIFISPSFRANTIWVESSMMGLLFFTIGLYYFLKNLKQLKLKNIYLNILFIAIASYIRPSYCLFGVYFFWYYFSFFRNQISIYKVIFVNFILAFPAFYYVFILDIYFIGFHMGTNTGESGFNYFNKVAIISSIIIFHSFPFLYFKGFFLKELTQNKLLLLFSVIVSLFIIYNFNYDLYWGGGGIFLHISNFVTNNNYSFYLLLPIFIFFSLNISKISFFNNALVLLILFLLTPQYQIFHKYYDPLVLILCLTIINFDLNKKFFTEKKFIFSIYFVCFVHYLISFINSYYIHF